MLWVLFESDRNGRPVHKKVPLGTLQYNLMVVVQWKNPLHFVIFFEVPAVLFRRISELQIDNVTLGPSRCRHFSIWLWYFQIFSLKIHYSRVFKCLGNKRFQPTKNPPWWCHLGSWTWRWGGAHPWRKTYPFADCSNGLLGIFKPWELTVVQWGDDDFLSIFHGGSWWCQYELMEVGASIEMMLHSNWWVLKAICQIFYTSKKFGTWTMIVFGWFNHEEVVWVMKIKDCQMSGCQWDLLWKRKRSLFIDWFVRKNALCFLLATLLGDTSLAFV